MSDVLERLVEVDDAVEALSRYISQSISMRVEEVSLLEAYGRVVALDIVASEDRPLEDLSAVDGYAVNSIETTGSSQYNPREFRVIGVLRPGHSSRDLCLEPGTAIRVHTGAPVPCGADSIVMDEDVKVSHDKIYVYKPVAKGSNVILRGEDFKKGEILAEEGSIVKPPLIAALASIGVNKIPVYEKIRVSVITVGDELVEPGEQRIPGKAIYNTTAYLLYSLIQADGIFTARYAGITPDNPEYVEDAIAREIEQGAQLVLTCGGTGVSESDVISVVAKRSDRVLFRGVRLRPGRPTTSFIYRGKVVVSLSGFPVAAWSGYELIVRRAISRAFGIKGMERNYVYAVLTRRIPNTAGYTSIIRVSIRSENGIFYAEPYMLRGSGVISSLLRTNGYIIIPEELEGYDKGDTVRVYLYE